MVDVQTRRGMLAVVFGGATVFSAVLLLGYLVFADVAGSLGAQLLGLGILLLALVVAAGAWSEHRGLLLAAWLATGLLLVLGFVGIAVGPQIIGVAAFALLTAIVATSNDRRA